MIQIARNLTDGIDGFFEGKRYLIHDRDPLYTQQFLSMLGEAGIESVKLPLRAPNLKAYVSNCTSLEHFGIRVIAGRRRDSFLPNAFRGWFGPGGS
jgi:hypothetical protein